MHYDLFICYSPKDSADVNSLISRLSRDIPSIKIWCDIAGSKTSDGYRRNTPEIIDNSVLFLFVCSDNSLASKYCEKEILYAQNVGKQIIPYLVPGARLKGWFLFEFGNIDCVHSNNEQEVTKMIGDIKGKLGLDTNPQNISTSQSNSESVTNSTHLESQLEFDPISGEFKQKAQSSDSNKTKAHVGFINGHAYVDMGLPSGLKWAGCNIGAKRPEEYGVYFSWGEIKPKSYFSPENSETNEKDIQWLKSQGYLGGEGNLTSVHDAARQNWGGTWRLPTKAEIEELIENTSSEWGDIDGVMGRLLRSNINGSCIFIPTSGWIFRSECSKVGVYGSLWSSTPNINSDEEAITLDISSDGVEWGESPRDSGLPIRPVSD